MSDQNMGVSRSYQDLMKDDEISSRNPSQRDLQEIRQHFTKARNSVQHVNGRNGELSGSFLPDEFGSAEAMEYTPSNTSVNNSIPTHLVTQSNSNIGMSGTKGSYIQLGQFQNSPSPQHLSEPQNMVLVSNYQSQASDVDGIANVTVLAQDMRPATLGRDMKAEPRLNQPNQDLNDLIESQYDHLLQQQRVGAYNRDRQPKFIMPKRRPDQSITESFGHHSSKNGTPGFQPGSAGQQFSQETVKASHVEPFTFAHPQESGQQPVSNSNSVQPSQHVSPQTSYRTTPQQQVRHGVISLGNVSLVEKLSAKIKEQADRLQQYENYYKLCEQRILRLDPKHPLPIQYDHLQSDRFTYTFNEQPKQTVNPQILSHLQQRVSELSQQINQKAHLEQRLKLAEESLRKETLESEEQRAYIQMLKEQLADKISNLGISFESSANRTSGGKRQKPVDGFIQLIQTQKQVEDLSRINERLRQELDQQRATMEFELVRQKEDYQSQIQVMENNLRSYHDKEGQLMTDKDTLLEYAKDSIEKQQQAEQSMKSLEVIKSQQESQLAQLQQHSKQLAEELIQQKELVQEARANAEMMRKEKSEFIQKAEESGALKVKLATQLEALERQVAQLSADKVDCELSVKAKQRQIDLLTDSEAELRRQLARSNEQAKNLEKLLDEAKDNDRKKSAQGYELKRTLEESQRELAEVVKRYDQAVKDLEARENEQRDYTMAKLDAQREISGMQQLNAGLRDKEDKLQRELNEVYSSLRRKEEVLKQLEQRLTAKVDEKEKQNYALQQRIKALEETFDQKSHAVEMLERTSNHLSLKERDMAARLIEAEREMAHYKQTVEEDFFVRESELLQELRNKSDEAQNLSHQVAYLERELGELRISKEIAERVLEERGSILQTLEQEVTRKTENLARWEGEVKRLETALENKDSNNASLKGEFDRAREQRVDDAMLIDRLRQQQSDVLGVVNEMVGKLANFVHSVCDVGQASLDIDMEQAVTLAARLSPATTDVQQPLEQLNRIIGHICRCSLTLIQNLPQRDSDHHAQSNEYFNTGNTGMHQEIAYPSNNEEVHYHDTNFTLVSPYQHNTQREGMPYGVLSKADLGVHHAKSQSAFANLTTVQGAARQDSVDISSHPEMQNAKRRQQESEATEQLLRDHKRDLEQALSQICNLSSLQNPLKKLFNQLLQTVTDTASARADRHEVAGKLLANEQKYHTMSKRKQRDILSDPNHELIVLKSMIERERTELRDIEKRISDLTQKQQQLRNNISSANAMSFESNNLSQFQVQSLKSQLDEVKKQRDDYREQYEWTQTRLKEQELMIASFRPQGQRPEISQVNQKSQIEHWNSPEFEVGAEVRKSQTIQPSEDLGISKESFYMGFNDHRNQLATSQNNIKLDTDSALQQLASQNASSSRSPIQGRLKSPNPYKNRHNSATVSAVESKGTMKSEDELSRASDIIRKKYSRIGASRQQSDSQSPMRQGEDRRESSPYQPHFTRPLKRSPPKTSNFNV